jgi:ADP-heptose:LPS heptosyltransferase/glycosyltransferase involved in cell wall biosynthesis
MRILIDLQGAQTGSRFRGIGRSSLARAKSIIRNRGDHEILLLLNGLFEDTIEPIRADFSAILPADNILVFSVPSPVSALAAENAWRIEAAELIRESMIDALAPDVVLITSLFEGPSDPAIVSIGRLDSATKTAVILHDLIPFLDPETHLGDPEAKKWYNAKIEYLRRADLLLAVSDSAWREAVNALGFDDSHALSVSSAADECFTHAKISPEPAKALLQRIGVRSKFVMHASKIEPRKNFDGLIRAFGLLPKAVRETHQLVLVGEHDATERGALRRLASDAGLAPDALVFAGHVSDSELACLYSQCTLYVMPSFHEGFGLPALEAMSCGAAAIGSNTTSIPEVIGRKDALFDPHSDRSMAALIERALTDAKFWRSLKDHAGQWSKHFSWDRSAQLSLTAMEKLVGTPTANRKSHDVSLLLGKVAAIRAIIVPERKDLVAAADSIAKNERAIFQRRPGSDNAAERRAGPGLEPAESGERRYDENFVENLYRIFHQREPDPGGFAAYLKALRAGRAPHELVAEFLNSAEFSNRSKHGQRVAPGFAAPPSDPVIEVIRHQVWGPEDKPHILLLKLDHIGDFVMTLDAFRLIRGTWPNAEITLVCGPWNTSIAEQSGLFDSVLSCNFYPDTTTNYDKEGVIKHGLTEYGSLTLGTYDLAVDLRYFDDNRILLSHTEAKYRAGYAADGVPLDLALPAGSEHNMMAHMGARTMALAAAVAWTFGTPAGGARTGLLNGRSPVRHFKDGVVAGISPGTRNALRSWGRERFAELARLLCERGFRIALIGSRADRPDTQFIAACLSKADVIDLAGTLPIADIPAVFAGLDLFIGGETGTTHMAAAMGVPTICIYSGQTNVDSFRPVGPHVVTLRGNVSCSPCFLATVEECRWGKRCMDIPPARVAAEATALHEHLSSTRPTARRLAANQPRAGAYVRMPSTAR